MMRPDNTVHLGEYLSFIGKDRCLYLLDAVCNIDQDTIEQMPIGLRKNLGI